MAETLKGLKYDEVSVGDELPAQSKEVHKMDLIVYAGASGDFNPIHVDDEFAKNVGLGGVIAHGLLNMATLCRSLTDWLGDPGILRRLKVRFDANVRPGDTVTTKGKVTEKRVEDGRNLVVLEVGMVNQDGAEVLSRGEAVAELP